MFENPHIASNANPHERTVFQLGSQPPSHIYATDPKVLRDTLSALGKKVPNTAQRPYLLADLPYTNVKQSSTLAYPFPVEFPPTRLPEFLRKKVFPRERAIRSDLSDALAELQQATKDAQEEGFDLLPSDLALSNAGRVLIEMYRISPQRFEVYPTPDAEIAIRALAPRRSVILLCESLGGALCLVNVNSGRRRKRYGSADALPDSFLREALLDLKGKSI